MTRIRSHGHHVRVAAVALVLTLLSASFVFAHDTWLAPLNASVAVGDTMRFDMTSGGKFPTLESAIARSRVRTAMVRLAATTTAMAAGKEMPNALRLHAVAGHAGVATVWVALAPRTLTLDPDKIDEYLDDIAASKAVRDRWRSIPAKSRWTEAYAKHAKTFVLAGSPPHDTSWRLPVGLALEIVPERDPTALRAGDTLVVRLLKRGGPSAALSLGAEREGAGPAGVVWVTTDAGGRARVPLGAAGHWLLHATDLRPSRRAGLAWESDFTTLTLTVRPR